MSQDPERCFCSYSTSSSWRVGVRPSSDSPSGLSQACWECGVKTGGVRETVNVSGLYHHCVHGLRPPSTFPTGQHTQTTVLHSPPAPLKLEDPASWLLLHKHTPVVTPLMSHRRLRPALAPENPGTRVLVCWWEEFCWKTTSRCPTRVTSSHRSALLPDVCHVSRFHYNNA